MNITEIPQDAFDTLITSVTAVFMGVIKVIIWCVSFI